MKSTPFTNSGPFTKSCMHTTPSGRVRAQRPQVWGVCATAQTAVGVVDAVDVTILVENDAAGEAKT